MEQVSFEPPSETEEGLEVLVMQLSGESFSAFINKSEDGAIPTVSIASLQEAIAGKLGLETFEFKLSLEGGILAGDVLVSTLLPAEETTAEVYMVKQKVLEKHEQEGLQAWREVAAGLQNVEIDDNAMLLRLRDFLDSFPALVNWQHTASEEIGHSDFKPLLLFATQDIPTKELRQQCVDELLRRGARVHIRHESGYLIQSLQSGEETGVFFEYLKKKGAKYAEYESRATGAWRKVALKLSGTTRERVWDEDEMAQIVIDFCAKYPEMVNFQNNLDIRFGYAPLMSFAGLCSAPTRKRSILHLLAHGARMNSEHGGQTSMEWMRDESSPILDWLQQQQHQPAPPQSVFNFERA